MSPYLTRESRIIRMERALQSVNLVSEWQRFKAYRAAGIEAIELGDDADAVLRAEIYRSHVMVLPRLPKAAQIKLYGVIR